MIDDLNRLVRDIIDESPELLGSPIYDGDTHELAKLIVSAVLQKLSPDTQNGEARSIVNGSFVTVGPDDVLVVKLPPSSSCVDAEIFQAPSHSEQ